MYNFAQNFPSLPSDEIPCRDKGSDRVERLSIFQRLRGFFMMDRDKGRQQPQNNAGRPGGDPQALYREDRPRAREGADTASRTAFPGI